MSEATTRGIRVIVEPAYQPRHSSVENSYFFWTYSVNITNTGDRTVQLISRHWIITDATGHVEEVQGEGVVGQQPVLEPGESFEYTSACPLSTPSGSMRGTYRMITQDGESFEAIIAPFFLESEIVYH